MKTSLLQFMVTSLMGSVITVGGVTMHASDIMANAQSAVNGENTEQLATVLELYYSDHGQYPNVEGGSQLISVLKNGNYIMNEPNDISDIEYTPEDNGQNYSLAIEDTSQTSPANETPAGS